MINTGKLAGRTVFITGASRGIGKAIALKVAKDGANVVVAAKTAEPHPKLPGTIYTTCKEVEEVGGQSLACIVDVRDELQVRRAVEEAVKKFGGIDIVVNNASAISRTPTADTEMKRYDLMHNINTRGTFLVTKECLPYLKKSSHAHVLNISPPLNMAPRWFKDNVAYAIAKYGMSMCVLGMHEEFRTYNIAVNALWPRTTVHTAAIIMVRGPQSVKYSRKPEIMGDAAYAILTEDPKTTTGNFFIDEIVLKQRGITDFDQYAVDASYKDQLISGLFLDCDGGKVAELFRAIDGKISYEMVQQIQGICQFVVTGNEAGKWFIDLKNGQGSCKPGESQSPPDATLTTDSETLVDMFEGKIEPTTALMTGKLQISGDVSKAWKFRKLMGPLSSKL